MSTRLFVSLLGGALMVPLAASNAGAASDNLALPPIPYAETIPWLTAGTVENPRSYLGLLLAPRPLVVTPIDFAAVPAPSPTMLSSQLTVEQKIFTE